MKCLRCTIPNYLDSETIIILLYTGFTQIYVGFLHSRAQTCQDWLKEDLFSSDTVSGETRCCTAVRGLFCLPSTQPPLQLGLWAVWVPTTSTYQFDRTVGKTNKCHKYIRHLTKITATKKHYMTIKILKTTYHVSLLLCRGVRSVFIMSQWCMQAPHITPATVHTVIIILLLVAFQVFCCHQSWEDHTLRFNIQVRIKHYSFISTLTHSVDLVLHAQGHDMTAAWSEWAFSPLMSATLKYCAHTIALSACPKLK